MLTIHLVPGCCRSKLGAAEMGGAARGRGPHVVRGEGLARPGAGQEAGEGVRRDYGRGD